MLIKQLARRAKPERKLMAQEGLAVTLTGDQRDLLADTEYGKEFQPGPVRVNPESKEKREKRLAARKARTLRAFQMAYEDHHRRKAS